MKYSHPLPEVSKQLLPKEAYTSEEWLDAENKHLFSNLWTFVGVESEFSEPGFYRTLKVGTYPMVVLRDQSGELRAFHNICRHRGTELLEGEGTIENAIICPYHKWTFTMDGSLRGLPNAKQCFPDMDKKDMGLFKGSVGVIGGMIFVHPQENPAQSFDSWKSALGDALWPHDLASGELVSSGRITYEMKCNWKVFYENAIDGYHLAYLHENTLGKTLTPKGQVWEAHGQHLVWYSTERDGEKHAIPKLIEEQVGGWGSAVQGAEKGDYPGVVMLFPNTLVTPNPWGISVSTLVPVSPGITHMVAETFAPKSWLSMSGRGDVKFIPGYDKDSGLIKSDNWKIHPLETGDFQTEDVWVCEKMQRSLESPLYAVGGLANGAGAEAPITLFQQCLLDYMPDMPGVEPMLEAAE